MPVLRVLTEDEEQAIFRGSVCPLGAHRHSHGVEIVGIIQFALERRGSGPLDAVAPPCVNWRCGGLAVVTGDRDGAPWTQAQSAALALGVSGSQKPTRPVNIHAFYVGRLETAIKRAGIAWCAWKDLRYACGVRLAKQGIPVCEITSLLRQREIRRA